MLSRNIFFGLLIFCMAILSSFYVFIYNPKQEKNNQLREQLQATKNNFNSAKRAEKDLKNIQELYEKQKGELQSVKDRFINKNNLSEITRRIRRITAESNLKLVDFTPIFTQYFADTSNSNIKPLPFSISVKGGFLDIGKFIEGWEDKEFHIVPDGIYLDRVNARSNELEANITGYLYAWVSDQE